MTVSDPTTLEGASSLFSSNPIIYEYGSKKPTWLALIASVLAASTILLCYTIAVHLGHVQPWPNTDITHCALDGMYSVLSKNFNHHCIFNKVQLSAPERFIFRMGLIPASTMMIFLWQVIRGWISGGLKYAASIQGENSRARRFQCPCSTYLGWMSGFGYVGSYCLVIASSVLESDGSTLWTVHVTCASTFFGLTIIAQIMLTIVIKYLMVYGGIPTFVGYKSITVKILCNFSCILLLIITGISSLVGAPAAVGDAIEWFLVGLILIYFLSVAWDWNTTVTVSTVVTVPNLQVPPETLVPGDDASPKLFV